MLCYVSLWLIPQVLPHQHFARVLPQVTAGPAAVVAEVVLPSRLALADTGKMLLSASWFLLLIEPMKASGTTGTVSTSMPHSYGAQRESKAG